MSLINANQFRDFINECVRAAWPEVADNIVNGKVVRYPESRPFAAVFLEAVEMDGDEDDTLGCYAQNYRFKIGYFGVSTPGTVEYKKEEIANALILELTRHASVHDGMLPSVDTVTFDSEDADDAMTVDVMVDWSIKRLVQAYGETVDEDYGL